MPRCWNCKGSHPTVADVKACHDADAEAAAQAKAEADAERRTEEFFESGTDMDRMRSIDEADRDRMRSWSEEDDPNWLLNALSESVIKLEEEALAAQKLDTMTGAPGRDMASDKQVKYALDLLQQRQWPDVLVEDDIRNMERRQVTKLIDGLKASPRRKDSPIPDVPVGRYALVEDGGAATGGILRFYQVNESKAGNLWLQQLFGAPGDYRKEYVKGMRAARIMKAIHEDPQEAGLRYGKESGVCGVCRSPLTNAHSLERGIGPVCAKKMGW